MFGRSTALAAVGKRARMDGNKTTSKTTRRRTGDLFT
jgi:hypothetical protein